MNECENFKLANNAIWAIPPFDGDENKLFSFISRMEALREIIDALNIQYKPIILGAILDKIVGRAQQTLVAKGSLNNWLEIKTALIEAHGGADTAEVLIDKIRVCRCIHNIESFYKRMNNLLCKLNNRLMLTGGINSVDFASNQRIAFESFKNGLPEPVRGIIIARNVTTLNEAFQIIQSNGYANFRNNTFNQRHSERNQYTEKRSEQRESQLNRFQPNHFHRNTHNNNEINRNAHNYNQMSRNINNNSNNINRKTIYNTHQVNRNIHNNSGITRNTHRSDQTMQTVQSGEPMSINTNEIYQQNFQEAGRNDYPI